MQDFRVWSWPGLLAGVLLIAGATRDIAVSPQSGPECLAMDALDGPVQARVERVVDGDTIEVRVQIWLGESLSIRVRLDGVDAPELEARCPEERRMAEAARDFLVRRLDGAEVRLSHVVYDKYGGRVRADVTDSAGDVAAALLAAHLARPYHGERRQPWCGLG
jgi:micrococcal nuclease